MKGAACQAGHGRDVCGDRGRQLGCVCAIWPHDDWKMGLSSPGSKHPRTHALCLSVGLQASRCLYARRHMTLSWMAPPSAMGPPWRTAPSSTGPQWRLCAVATGAGLRWVSWPQLPSTPQRYAHGWDGREKGAFALRCATVSETMTANWPPLCPWVHPVCRASCCAPSCFPASTTCSSSSR